MQVVMKSLEEIHPYENNPRINDKAAAAVAAYFKHILKPFKVGVLVKDKEKIDAQMRYLFKKWAKEPKCLCKIKEKRVKG